MPARRLRAGAVGYVPGAVEGDPATQERCCGRQRRGGRPAGDGARAAAGTARGRRGCRRADRAECLRCSACCGVGQSTAAVAERLQIAPVTVRAGTYRSWFGSWASRTGRSCVDERRAGTRALSPRTGRARFAGRSVPRVPEQPARSSEVRLLRRRLGLRITLSRDPEADIYMATAVSARARDGQRSLRGARPSPRTHQARPRAPFYRLLGSSAFTLGCGAGALRGGVRRVLRRGSVRRRVVRERPPCR